MNNTKKQKKLSRVAQSIIELAIFGAILFFLITGIALNFLSGSFEQNAQLQAMRIAMARSYNSSEHNLAARVQATFVLYEDRLSGDFGKYGFQDRQPIVVTGSAMLNKLLQMPFDFGLVDHIPLLDMKVNGQEFHLSTGAFVRYKIFLRTGASAPTFDAANPDDVLIMSMPLTGSHTAGYPDDGLCPGDAGMRNLNSSHNELARQRLTYEWINFGTQGTIEKIRLTTINGVIGTSLDPDAAGTIWTSVSSTRVRLTAFASPTETDVKTSLSAGLLALTGSSPTAAEVDAAFNQVWPILKEAEIGYPPFYTKLYANSSAFNTAVTAQREFDYNRNALFADDFPSSEYEDAAWQWNWSSMDEVIGKINYD
ncbi:MAG: hypothetical protein WCI27_06850, partial [Candidatus Omnitrophota bacterium]